MLMGTYGTALESLKSFPVLGDGSTEELRNRIHYPSTYLLGILVNTSIDITAFTSK